MENFKFFRWDITSRCNMNCRHCYASDMYKEKVGAKNITFYGEEVRKEARGLIDV